MSILPSLNEVVNFIDDDEIGKKIIQIEDDMNNKITEDIKFIFDTLFDIDTAEGYWLDLIGLWVGQPRVVPFSQAKFFYGTREQLQTAPVTGNKLGRIRKFGESMAEAGELTDPDYRIAIKAKIMQNKGDTTLPAIASSLAELFQTNDIVLTQTPKGLNAQINRDITASETVLINKLDLFPVAGGINFTYQGL